MRLLIRNGYILSLNDEDAIYEKGNIFIDGSKIIAVGHGLELDGFKPDQVIEASDKIVVPGFINADLHATEVVTKGLYENLPQTLRPDQDISRFGKNPVDWVYKIAMMAGMQSIETGVTTIQSHWQFSDEFALEGTKTALNAAQDLGIRAGLALEIVSGDTQRTIQTYEDVFSNCQQVVVAPSEKLIADKRFVEWLVQLPAEMVFHFHFAQTKSHVLRSTELFSGKTGIFQAAQSGIFEHQTNVSQAVWITEEEIGLLARNGVAVIHTPLTDLYTGSGVTPLHRLKEAGVPIALGTGPFCGGNLNILSAAKMTASIQRIVQPDFSRWISVVDTLHMLTRGGAQACFSGERMGQIAVGSEADLVLYDRTGFSFSPLNNPMDQLVCLENGNSVDIVLVGGKIVVNNGKAATVDRDQIRKDFRQDQALMHAFRENIRTEKVLESQYVKDVQHPMSIHRWADTPVLDSRLEKITLKKD